MNRIATEIFKLCEKYQVVNLLVKSNARISHSTRKCASEKFLSNRTFLVSLSLPGILSGMWKGDDYKLKEEIKKAESLVQESKSKEAEKLLAQLLEKATNDGNEALVLYINEQQGKLALISKQYKRSEELYLRVISKMIEKGCSDTDEKLIHLKLQLASIYAENLRSKQAEEIYVALIDSLKPLMQEAKENVNSVVLLLWVKVLKEYSKFLSMLGRLDLALTYSEDAYSVCLLVNGETHEQTITLLKNLGFLELIRGETEKALKYLEKGLKIGENFPDFEDLSLIHALLGRIYLIRGLVEKAENHCNTALIGATKYSSQSDIKQAAGCLLDVYNAAPDLA